MRTSTDNAPSPDVVANLNEDPENDASQTSAIISSEPASRTLSPDPTQVHGTIKRDINWTNDDMTYCMATIEIDDFRRGRRRRLAYMVSVPGHPTRLRSYMQLANVIPMMMMKEDGSEKRLPHAEQRRRQIMVSLRKMDLRSRSNPKVSQLLQKLFAEENELDNFFLKKSAQSSAKDTTSQDTIAIGGERSVFSQSKYDGLLDNFTSAAPLQNVANRRYSISSYFRESNVSSPSMFTNDLKAVRMEGAVAVCTGRRSWSEEWAVLNGRYLEIFMPQMPKHLQIPRIWIGQIKSVGKLERDDKPFQGYEFFSIGTPSRVYYFCVKNAEILEQWLDALLVIQRPSPAVLKEVTDEHTLKVINSAYPSLGEELLCDSDEPEACIVHSGDYLSSLPPVLNMRCMAFKNIAIKREMSQYTISPVELSQDVLRRIVRYCNPRNDALNSSVGGNSSSEWVQFSDRIHLLQIVSLGDLTRDELTAFFLNVYHTLLTHAFVVYGVPSRAREWKSLKEKAVYEIAGDLVSLRDIDEIILGNSCNEVIISSALRRSITYVDAVKRCETNRNLWLNRGVVFPFAGLYMGREIDQKVASSLLGQANVKVFSGDEIAPMENIDWRIALCINSGCTIVANDIVLYSGENLDAQLDSRCKTLLLNLLQIDLNPSKLLGPAMPSITLPLPLSTLLLVTHSKTMRLMPSPLLETTSPDDPLFWVNSIEYFLASQSDVDNGAIPLEHVTDTVVVCEMGGIEMQCDGNVENTTDSSALMTESDDLQTKISMLEKLRSLEKAKRNNETEKVEIFFIPPAYNSFRFLKITSEKSTNIEKYESFADDTFSENSSCRNNGRGRYQPVTTPQRDNMKKEMFESKENPMESSRNFKTDLPLEKHTEEIVESDRWSGNVIAGRNSFDGTVLSENSTDTMHIARARRTGSLDATMLLRNKNDTKKEKKPRRNSLFRFFSKNKEKTDI